MNHDSLCPHTNLSVNAHCSIFHTSPKLHRIRKSTGWWLEKQNVVHHIQCNSIHNKKRTVDEFQKHTKWLYDSIYMKHAKESRSIETESRLVAARRWGRDGDCKGPWGNFQEVEMSCNWTVVIAELYTKNGWILWYVNYTSIKLFKEKKERRERARFRNVVLPIRPFQRWAERMV